MGHRINERNTGKYTLGGELKVRKKKSSKVSKEEIEFAKKILEKVWDSLEHDETLSEGKGHLNPKAIFSDGGNFKIAMSGKDKDLLWDILYNRKF